jgi:hypothetical protein
MHTRRIDASVKEVDRSFRGNNFPPLLGGAYKGQKKLQVHTFRMCPRVPRSKFVVKGLDDWTPPDFFLLLFFKEKYEERLPAKKKVDVYRPNYLIYLFIPTLILMRWAGRNP